MSYRDKRGIQPIVILMVVVAVLAGLCACSGPTGPEVRCYKEKAPALHSLNGDTIRGPLEGRLCIAQ